MIKKNKQWIPYVIVVALVLALVVVVFAGRGNFTGDVTTTGSVVDDAELQQCIRETLTLWCADAGGLVAQIKCRFDQTYRNNAEAHCNDVLSDDSSDDSGGLSLGSGGSGAGAASLGSGGSGGAASLGSGGSGAGSPVGIGGGVDEMGMCVCVMDSCSISFEGTLGNPELKPGDKTRARLCDSYAWLKADEDKDEEKSQTLLVGFYEHVNRIGSASPFDREGLTLIAEDGATEGEDRVCTDWTEEFNVKDNQVISGKYVDYYGVEHSCSKEVRFDEGFPDIEFDYIDIIYDGCTSLDGTGHCESAHDYFLSPGVKIYYTIKNNPDEKVQFEVEVSMRYKGGDTTWNPVGSRVITGHLEKGDRVLVAEKGTLGTKQMKCYDCSASPSNCNSEWRAIVIVKGTSNSIPTTECVKVDYSC